MTASAFQRWINTWHATHRKGKKWHKVTQIYSTYHFYCLHFNKKIINADNWPVARSESYGVSNGNVKFIFLIIFWLGQPQIGVGFNPRTAGGLSYLCTAGGGGADDRPPENS